MESGVMKSNVSKAVFITLCFLLTSTGWMAWTYNVLSVTSYPVSDHITLVLGYLFQGAGIGVFSLLCRFRPGIIKDSMYAALLIHFFTLIPSVLCDSLILILICGFALSISCGYIAGCYLYVLTAGTDSHYRAITLGVGYAAAIFASWCLSMIGEGKIYYSDSVIIVCLVLTVLTVAIIHSLPQEEKDAADLENPALPVESMKSSVSGISPEREESVRIKNILILTALLITFFSIVNNCGFAFPSSDIGVEINVELSRLFYAGGIIIAGIVNERGRKYGGICAVIALIIPFIILSLKSEPVSANVLWSLSYFAFGFFTVYRLLLFSDLARNLNILYLSGLGLLFGRIGDAAGEELCLQLSNHYVILLFFSFLVFAASVFLFFCIFNLLYVQEFPEPKHEESLVMFNRFSRQYSLSIREREVLRCLLEEKSNIEIADVLSVSESTVKYHIHNLLKKTGCRNRVSLIASYFAGTDAEKKEN